MPKKSSAVEVKNVKSVKCIKNIKKRNKDIIWKACVTKCYNCWHEWLLICSIEIEKAICPICKQEQHIWIQRDRKNGRLCKIIKVRDIETIKMEAEASD